MFDHYPHFKKLYNVTNYISTCVPDCTLKYIPYCLKNTVLNDIPIYDLWSNTPCPAKAVPKVLYFVKAIIKLSQSLENLIPVQLF